MKKTAAAERSDAYEGMAMLVVLDVGCIGDDLWSCLRVFLIVGSCKC